MRTHVVQKIWEVFEICGVEGKIWFGVFKDKPDSVGFGFMKPRGKEEFITFIGNSQGF